MAEWHNADGLHQKFGPAQHRSSHGGGQIAGHTFGESCVEVEINLDELSTTAIVLSHSVWLPHDSLITHVRIVPIESAAGSNALLDVGLGYYVGTTLTELGSVSDHIVNAHPTVAMAVGEVSDSALASDSAISDMFVEAVATGGGINTGTETASTVNRYYFMASESDGNAFSGGIIKVMTFFLPLGVQKGSTPTA